MGSEKSLFWHRRDLRIEDNCGLYKCLKNGDQVIPVFIFDENILSKLDKEDARISFIHDEIQRVKKQYQHYGSDLLVYSGDPIKLIPEIAKEFACTRVYTNRDYEPYALERDKKIFEILNDQNINFIGSKDHVIFEKSEVVKNDGTPYLVFTPYSKKWKMLFSDQPKQEYNTLGLIKNLIQVKEKQNLIELKNMGFEYGKSNIPKTTVSKDLIRSYHDNRNFPSIDGTSRLGIHLRFGTISIRALVNSSKSLSETFINELIWRDFYQMIIFHFPHSAENSFRKEYDLIEWEKNMDHFELWCMGKTGYPIVDAGMRELNQTGYMHNRVRMIVASFLTKHLLIDWRLGEAYFASKLLDYELASNIGGWQWAAGSGCDAAPYFRIFNPTTQQQKFDSGFKYIKKWIPEFGTKSYPEPIIDHKFARERALNRFKIGLKKI